MAEEIYTLIEPIYVNGERVETLTLRSVKVRDLKQVNHIEDAMEKGIALISKTADLTPENVEDLSALDFTELSNLMGKSMGVNSEESENAGK